MRRNRRHLTALIAAVFCLCAVLHRLRRRRAFRHPTGTFKRMKTNCLNFGHSRQAAQALPTGKPFTLLIFRQPKQTRAWSIFIPAAPNTAEAMTRILLCGNRAAELKKYRCSGSAGICCFPPTISKTMNGHAAALRSMRRIFRRAGSFRNNDSCREQRGRQHAYIRTESERLCEPHRCCVYGSGFLQGVFRAELSAA